MILQSKSLVARLIVWQLLGMLCLWLFLLGWLINQMTAYGNGDLDHRMEYFASILAETAAGAKDKDRNFVERVQAVERVFVTGVIETLGNAPRYEAKFQLLDGSGKVLLSSPGAPQAAWIGAAGFGDFSSHDTHFRAVRVRSTDGSVEAIVAESDAVRNDSLWPMLKIIGVGQLLILLASCLGLWLTAILCLRPIRALSVDIAARKTGDLKPVDTAQSYRELAPLLEAFNDLLRREGDRLDSERGFLADAAHELRTPIAAMAIQARRLLESSAPADRAIAAEQLELGVRRVSHLMSQLLTTARIASSPALLACEPVDAAEIVRERLAAFYARVRAKQIRLSFEGPEHSWIRANPFGIGSILDNLLDNALKYTPADGEVRVGISTSDSLVELRVADSGPGIPSELHERVFERFYRAPGEQVEGSGLGLHIVRRLAEAYGAVTRLGPGLGGRGLSVSILLGSMERTEITITR